MNADELKKADEIVRTLRDYASDCDSDSEYCFQCTFACVCDKFDNNAPKIIADLIDSLTAQLASVTAERDALIEDFTDFACGGCANAAPYCANKSPECTDAHEWCIDEKCKGFRPSACGAGKEQKHG